MTAKLRWGIALVAVIIPVQMFFGHLTGEYVLHYQPAKFAAIAVREVRARVSSTGSVIYIRCPDPLRLGRTSIAPLADSRRLTLRLAVEGSAARPAEPINHQRVCLVVS
jgi:hypothetical protein